MIIEIYISLNKATCIILFSCVSRVNDFFSVGRIVTWCCAMSRELSETVFLFVQSSDGINRTTVDLY